MAFWLMVGWKNEKSAVIGASTLGSEGASSKDFRLSGLKKIVHHSWNSWFGVPTASAILTESDRYSQRFEL